MGVIARWRRFGIVLLHALVVVAVVGGVPAGVRVPESASATPLSDIGPTDGKRVAREERAPASFGPGTVDATAFGAVGDGAADDTAAIQGALNTAAAMGGGWTVLPAGRYRITAPLHVGQAVTLLGEGWTAPGRDSNSASVLAGSWLIVDASLVSSTAILMEGRGSVLRDIGIWHEQPAPGPGWIPRPFGWAVEAKVPDVLVRQVHLANPTLGIRGFGRTTIEGISGQPLEQGIRIEGALDVVRIRDVTFVPGWSSAPVVATHQRTHGVGIDSRRNDNPDIAALRLDGYGTGVLLGQAADGSTAKMALMDATFRSCGTALVVDAPGTIGAAARLDIADCDDGVIMRSQGTLMLSTVKMRELRGSALRADGPQALLFADDLEVANWARSDPAVAALVANGSLASIQLGPTRRFDGDCGRIIVSGQVNVTDRATTVTVPPTSTIPQDHSLLTPGALDASTFGAVGDGVVDDAAAIQSALDTAGNGGEVRLAAGTYRLGSGLQIPSGVTLTGIGFQAESTGNFDPVTGAIVHPFTGTYLRVPPTNTQPAVTVGDQGKVRNLAVQHEQPPIGPGWTPHPFDFAVRLAGSDSVARDLFLLNPTKGLEVAPSAGGQVLVSRVFGEPFAEGLHIDAGAQVRVDNIHFWPFVGYLGTGSYGTILADWVQVNGVGARLDRSERSELSSVFSFGYRTGMIVRSGAGAPSGGPRMPYVWNFDADHSVTGIAIDAAGSTATIVNARAQGDTSLDGAGLEIGPTAANASIAMRNVDIGVYPGSAIVVEAPTAQLSVDLAALVRNDRNGTGAPLIDLGGADGDEVGALVWPFDAAHWPASPAPLTITGCTGTPAATPPSGLAPAPSPGSAARSSFGSPGSAVTVPRFAG